MESQLSLTLIIPLPLPLRRQKGLKTPGGWGLRKMKCMKLIWNFQTGAGLGKTPFCGGGIDTFWKYNFFIS